jgi:hypothetical protein
MKIARHTKSFILSLGLLLGLSACVYDPYYHGPGPARHTYYPYYYPFYYDYYFYPSVQVYFNFSTGYYYYLKGKRWIRTKVLPPHIHLDPRERVTTRVEGDKPYLKNEQHLRQYKTRPDYRPNPQLHRKEQLQNLKSYELHKKKQEIYKKDWEKGRKRR